MISFELKHSVQTSHLYWDFMPWMFSMCFARSYIFTIRLSQMNVCSLGAFTFPHWGPHNLQLRGVHSWSELKMLLYLGIYLCTLDIGMLRYFDHVMVDCMWALSCGLSSTVSSQIAQLNPWLSNMCGFMISLELKHSLKTLHLCCRLLPWMSCASPDLLCLQFSCHTLCTQGAGVRSFLYHSI